MQLVVVLLLDNPWRQEGTCLPSNILRVVVKYIAFSKIKVNLYMFESSNLQKAFCAFVDSDVDDVALQGR